MTTGAAGFGTAGTLTGTVDLTNDSAIEFASGQISTIGAGSQLTLNGNNAYVEDGTSGRNSALTGLATVAGSLYLDERGQGVARPGRSPTAAFSASTTLLTARAARPCRSPSGLTNTGTLDIGNSGLSSSDSVTAASFVNSGTVNLTGRRDEFRRPQRVGSDDQQRRRFRSPPTPRRSPERSAARGPSASQPPIFGSTRAFRPGRPSTRPARTGSRSSWRRTSPARSAVSGTREPTRSTRRTLLSPERSSISSRIRRTPAARSP